MSDYNNLKSLDIPHEINQHIHEIGRSSHDIVSQRGRLYQSSVKYTPMNFSYNYLFSQNILAPPSYKYNCHGQKSSGYRGNVPSGVS